VTYSGNTDFIIYVIKLLLLI